MAFFFNEARKAPPKPTRSRSSAKQIPIESLNKIGCSACPRSKEWDSMNSPKMEPTGARSPVVYLLGTGPNEDEDYEGRHWEGPAGAHILGKFSRETRRSMRFGHLMQCMPPLEGKERNLVVDPVSIECCRGRVVGDIEATKPMVIVGIGDQPLRWATGMDGKANALKFRGRMIPVRIGTHECWYLPLIWPNYLERKKTYGKSEYELAIEHDIRALEWWLENDGREPTIYRAPFDGGIELITGEEPGDFQRLERALADLINEPRSSIDLETNGLRVYHLKQPKIWTAAVGTFKRTVAFSVEHPMGWGSESRIRKVFDLLGEYLLFSGEKSAHNLAMELEWLHYVYGPHILRATDWNDTMSMAHTLDERPGTKSLEVQTILNFGFNLKAQSRVDPGIPNWINFFPIKEVLRYNGMDTKWTDLLRDHLAEKLDDEDPTQWTEHQRKVRLAPTLILMEAKGLPVDFKYAQKLADEYDAKAKEIRARISRTPEVQRFTRQFGQFSPISDDQILKLMRDVLKRDEVRKEDRDGSIRFSTDEEALSAMPPKEVPSAPLILELRGIEKLSGTYLSPVLTGKIISVDQMIHARYGSMVAVTGRLNAEDPNTQNFPKRKHREVRGMVIAHPGGWILAADYGQIEFRVFAMATEDPFLIRACWTDYDVHAFWAQRFVDEYPEIKDQIVAEFGVDWDEKGLKTLRQEAKNKWVFPQLFGSSVRSCAEQLRIPEDVMSDLQAELWDQMPKAKEWQDRLLKNYERKLYVETLTGRRRRGPMTKNEIINMPIQGTAFDIVGAGMNALSERAQETDDWELQTCLQVHDDLSSWISDETLEQKMPIIAEEMCRHRFDFINVPLLVEMSIGANWADLQEVAKYRSDKLFNLRNPFK